MAKTASKKSGSKKRGRRGGAGSSAVGSSNGSSGGSTAAAVLEAAASGNGELTHVPMDDLQREMARRQRSLTRMENRRDRLLKDLLDLEEEIRAMGGRPAVSATAGVTMSGAPRKRPRNKKSLADMMVDVLRGQTMSVSELAEAVQNAGYMTTSATFRTIVNQTLIKDERFKKVSRGQYTVK